MNICLRLSDGRKIALSSGAKINAADLPGLQSVPPGVPVAIVSSHPTDPSIQGLQNLSQQSWRALLPNGESVEIKPGKNVRLTPGTRVSFGSIQGEIATSRGKAWLWAGIGSAALCLLTAGVWFFQHRFSVESAPREPVARNEQPARDETQKRQPEPKLPAQTQTPTDQKPAASSIPAEDAGQPQVAQNISRPAVSRVQPANKGIYALQDSIDFDCLDGAAIDAKSGDLSLFGHRADPSRVQRIPYYDYLATALECKAPKFSLEWTPSSYPQVSRVLKTGGQAILDAVKKFIDENGNLTFAGAWFLQQCGVPAVAGISQSTTLESMLEATNRPKTAEVVDRVTAWLHSRGDASVDAMIALCQTLGIEASYREFATKQRAGAIPQEQLMDEFFPKFFGAIAEALEAGSTSNGEPYKQSRARGKSVSEAFNDAQKNIPPVLERLMRRTLEQVLGKDSEIAVPRAIIAQVTGGVVPQVHPVFNDLPARSLLAKTAFQADVIGKLLVYAPQLKESIPTYRTESEFDRAQGRSSDQGYERCWIAPGKFELAQSPDKKTVRFTASSMTFNMRKVIVGASNARTDVPDPVLSQYAAELTNQFDAFEREIPVLHELRESMKVVAIARWLQKRGIRIEMPKEGRMEWTPPEEIPGVIHVVLSLHNGNAVVASAAEGGVDENVEPTIRDSVADQFPDPNDPNVQAKGRTEPFRWPGPVSTETLNGGLESLKAGSELTDIHVGSPKQVPHLWQQPVIPNFPEAAKFVNDHPELKQLLEEDFKRWRQQDQQYQTADPAKQPELKKQFEDETEKIRDEIKQKYGNELKNTYHVEIPSYAAVKKFGRKTLPDVNTDPNVVDARNVPSGLPKSVDDAIASGYAGAPPGVSDRVRKGFQAITTHDWKVARAWFQDALNHDPNNAGLKRLAELSDYTEKYREQKAASTSNVPNKPDTNEEIPANADPRTYALTSKKHHTLEAWKRFIEKQYPEIDPSKLPKDSDIKFLFPGLPAIQARELDDWILDQQIKATETLPDGTK